MSSGGTLYVISSGEVATSTALFRAVVEKLHRDCVYAGTFTAYHRIPNPVLFALDEVTQTAQVPLDQWLATSAGSGIQVCYVVHTPAQLRARYGTALADAIWALTGTKIVLGGNSDEQMGAEISRLCGQVPAGESMRPAVPEAYIRQLPESLPVLLDSCHPSGRGRRVKAREATACGLALTRRTRPRQLSSEEDGASGSRSLAGRLREHFEAC